MLISMTVSELNECMENNGAVCSGCYAVEYGVDDQPLRVSQCCGRKMWGVYWLLYNELIAVIEPRRQETLHLTKTERKAEEMQRAWFKQRSDEDVGD